MQTRACPSCHEIIPSDVDYCPFCGNSTRETIETEDDRIAIRNAELLNKTIAPGDDFPAYTDSGEPREAPRERAYVCLMCHKAPPTDGEYCADCRQKLDLGPEQWDLMKQQNFQRNLTAGLIVLVAVLTVAAVIAVAVVHNHAREVYAAPPHGATNYAPPPPAPGPGQPQQSAPPVTTGGPTAPGAAPTPGSSTAPGGPAAVPTPPPGGTTIAPLSTSASPPPAAPAVPPAPPTQSQMQQGSPPQTAGQPPAGQ